EYIPDSGALGLIFSVVPVSSDDRPKRLRVALEIRPSAVIFEANDRAPLPLDDDVADAARYIVTWMDCVCVEQPEPLQLGSLGRPVESLEQLIAAAHCQTRPARASELPHFATMSRPRNGDHDRPLAILVTPRDHQVDLDISESAVETNYTDRQLNAAP